MATSLGQTDNTPSHEKDLTGRDRIGRNVLASWGAYGVFVVAGFVTPRLIDQKIGQEALGVWDFAWSLVAYFGLVQAGVISSINRYVALFRATGDTDGINRAVSSVTCILAVMGLCIVALGAIAAAVLPVFLAEQLGVYLRDAQQLVIALCIGLAIQVGFSGYTGVLTGCHRWDIHQIAEAVTHGAIVAGIVILLLLDYGLLALGIANTVGQALGRGARVIAAYRVLPTLRVRLALATTDQAREMCVFGGKSFLCILADLCLTQGVSIAILSYLGPSLLAVYARPRSLIRHVNSLATKLANVLAPSASSLYATGRMDELRELYLRGTRLAAFVTIPLVVILVVLGEPILRIWMGDAYADGTLLTILAIGLGLPIVHEGGITVLMGMNSHGRVFAAKLLAAVLSLGAVVLILSKSDGSLATVALAATLPFAVVFGGFVPLYACSRLSLSYSAYFARSFISPCLSALPLLAVLLFVRWCCADDTIRSLVLGLPIGISVMGLTYWRLLVPMETRVQLRTAFLNRMNLGGRRVNAGE